MSEIKLYSTKKYTVSKDLYMQFMEPLGKTDGSVEAAWNFELDDWREDVIEATKKLAPSLIRYGGIFSAYYKWKEGIGPRDKREPMYNLEWGGLESNVVGTAEFVDFCRRVGAEPFINVNFESEGREHWKNPNFGKKGRNGTAEEAAEWVAFCNDPDNKLRNSLGHDPFNVKLWQIGNETTYIDDGFTPEECAKHTLDFAKKMKAADPSIKLMGWGDRKGVLKHVMEAAGEYLDYVDYHYLFCCELDRSNCPVLGSNYRNDAATTWDFFMNAYKYNEKKIARIREEVKGYDIDVAYCESHFGLKSNFRGEALTTFASAAGNARICNLYENNGDIIKIANNSDFCGNNWLVNSIMVPMPNAYPYPQRFAYLMPVAIISMLFSNNMGDWHIDCEADSALDIAASRTDDGKYYIHTVNTSFDKSITCDLTVDGKKITKGKMLLIDDDPLIELDDYSHDGMQIKEIEFEGSVTIPKASVCVICFDN